eukprot:gene11906-8496_t
MMFLVCLVVLIAVVAKAEYAALRTEALPSNTTTKFCSYQATCSVGGIEGVCVSISAGCCGGSVTSGLCPGSSDIKCCTNNPCSTPQGSGTCKQKSACSGTSVSGYCSGPSDLQCCVGGGGGCTLSGALNSGCNSASITAGLTNQIVSELNSMGYHFRGLNGNRVHCPGFSCTLQSSAADSLEAAAASVGDYITLNSAFRSSAEQYMLYQWYKRGQCGITLAAQPGSSNHEGGRAIDTSYYSYWNGPLSRYGWVHSYPSSDPVHFDYSGASDISSKNLLAFQRLWNRHNPNSKISEDGQYGPQTENALAHAPCGGW